MLSSLHWCLFCAQRYLNCLTVLYRSTLCAYFLPYWIQFHAAFRCYSMFSIPSLLCELTLLDAIVDFYRLPFLGVDRRDKVSSNLKNETNHENDNDDTRIENVNKCEDVSKQSGNWLKQVTTTSDSKTKWNMRMFVTLKWILLTRI